MQFEVRNGTDRRGRLEQRARRQWLPKRGGAVVGSHVQEGVVFGKRTTWGNRMCSGGGLLVAGGVAMLK